MKRPQTIRQRRAFDRAERKAAAAVNRLQKATHGNKRAHERAAIWAVKKALDLGPVCRPKDRV